jgi:hypothetical protein
MKERIGTSETSVNLYRWHGVTSNPTACRYTKPYESWGITGHNKRDYEDEEDSPRATRGPRHCSPALASPQPRVFLVRSQPVCVQQGHTTHGCSSTLPFSVYTSTSYFFVSASSFLYLHCRVTLIVLLHYFSFPSLSYHAMFCFFLLLLLVVFLQSSLSLHIVFSILVLFVYVALFS